ncbi:MAG: dihydroorotate dehydrogenase electron transfer subunit [candidate division Zixibacteria bacterium]|nr:dihydroorotate dehydrogenase electron transfer subunit [candidate division Zixibacteria bacterium]MDH3939288.1 dihydroorotate dehydrogenase electron transfer subunit [candidate division Zixibacteria bacterium]MDH4033880.1 dihydroorotate dehydrogenase electron transfer subunit [candidate division Zixibacteria bacterium]
MTKPKCESTPLINRRDLKNDYYSFTFAPYSQASDCRPGQFVHVKLPTDVVYFRRAFSVASVDSRKQSLELIFKSLGRGTKAFGTLADGDEVNILGPLGTSFKRPRKNETAVMIAGGVGFPPLMFFAQRLIEQGHDPQKLLFFYGGRSKTDIVERTRLKKMGVNLTVVTEDGSLGEKGLVVDPVQRYLDKRSGRVQVYSCGPPGMLKAVNDLGLQVGIGGQLSLEAPMPCGFGVCLGCVVPLTAGGHARVCREGPVFEIGEVAL